MIIAQASKIPLEEIVVEKDSELENALKTKGDTQFSLPMLELDDGDILT